MGNEGVGEGGEGWGGRGEIIGEKGGRNKILHVRSARRTKKEGGRQEVGRGGKEVDWGEPPPPPPSTTLFIPLGKSINAKIFWVMADFNPR